MRMQERNHRGLYVILVLLVALSPVLPLRSRPALASAPSGSDYDTRNAFAMLALDFPTNVTSSEGTYPDKVRVNWQSVSGATYYEVYRATSSGGVKTLLGSSPAAPFDDTTPTPGVTYYYWVKACNLSECSDFSDRYATGYACILPVAPNGVTASDGAYLDKVQVTWSAVADATYYQVYRAASSGGTRILLGSPTAATFDDTTVTPGVWYYWVKACKTCGCSDYSAHDTGYSSCVTPEPPTGVAASDGTYPDKVRITWAAVSGASNYAVYRSETLDGTKIHLGSPTGTTFDDSTAIGGTTYYYWLKACNSCSCSSYSPWNTGYACAGPTAPAGVAASDGTYTDKVRVAWQAVSGATHYEVYRAESSGGTKTVLGSPTATTLDDVMATPGTTYYYWVIACDTCACSAYGAYDTGYRSASPVTPTGVAASDGTYPDKVRVTWGAVSGVIYYGVYRATSSGGIKTLLGIPASASFDDSTAVPGTTYYYWVKACNTVECSTFSAYDTGYACAVPAAPAGVVASDGTYADRVQVTWNPVSGASYYQVYRAESADGGKTQLGSPAAASFADTGFLPGTGYYWVKACNACGCSDYSGYDTGYGACVTPGAPTGVEATDGTYPDRVRITWAAAPGATHYAVYRAGAVLETKIHLDSIGGTSFDDLTAVPGITCYYWVKACNSCDCSNYSAWNRGYACVAPEAPSSVAASDGTYADKVQVTWSAVSGAIYYEVYRAESSDGTRTLLGSPAETSLNDTTVATDTTYYYWIKACDACGCSEFSIPDTGLACVMPAAPTDVVASDGTYPDKVQVTWSAVVDATHYDVYRAESAEGTATWLGSSTEATFDDTTAVAGTTYYYWVKVCDNCGCSEFSASDTGYVCVMPLAPEGVTATNGTYADKVQVTWNAVSGANQYGVYRSDSAMGTKIMLGSPTEAAFDDTTAVAGVTYHYWASACNACGCSDFSVSDTGYACVLPAVPTGVAASEGTYPDKVQVTWSSVLGATYYEVYRATSATGATALLGSPTATTWDDTTAAAGTTYYYWAKACNTCGCSNYSAYDTGYRCTVPVAPAGVTASEGTYSDKVRVTWGSVSGATHYEVHRATSVAGTKTLLGSPTTATFDDSTAVAGTTYYYWVKACNACGCSDYSAPDTGYRCNLPAAPTGVAASDGTYSDKVRVTWSSMSGATNYELYRAESAVGTRTLLGSPTAVTFDDTTAVAGTTYYYWVKACKACGCSDLSGHDVGVRSMGWVHIYLPWVRKP